MANQYYNKIIINGQTKIDLTGDTVTAADLKSGVTAHGKDGAPVYPIMFRSLFVDRTVYINLDDGEFVWGCDR